MNVKYRVLDRDYKFEPTCSGNRMTPRYRRETNEFGEPYLVVDHFEDVQELIESVKPLDIRELVRQAQLAGEEYDPSKDTFGDVSQFGDIGDIVDRTLAFQRMNISADDSDISGSTEKSEVNENGSES